MFRVKICGVTGPEDAAVAAEAGADAIGLNFYEKSPRSVSLERAVEAAAAVAGGPLVVGVFVNATAESIAQTVAAVPLSAIQLHGDEPAELVAALPAGVPVIRAVRMGAEGLRPAAEQGRLAAEHDRPFAAFLADAAGAADEYGGTGRLADWSRFRDVRALLGQTPAILAGGLTPNNVAEAIAATGSDGVDTASGVESSPGIKDPEKVREFARLAIEAFEATSGMSG